VRTGKGRFDEGLLLRQLSPDGVLVYPETFGDLYRLRRAGDSFTRETWTAFPSSPWWADTHKNIMILIIYILYSLLNIILLIRWF
jgi:hypothetical protein